MEDESVNEAVSASKRHKRNSGEAEQDESNCVPMATAESNITENATSDVVNNSQPLEALTANVPARSDTASSSSSSSSSSLTNNNKNNDSNNGGCNNESGINLDSPTAVDESTQSLSPKTEATDNNPTEQDSVLEVNSVSNDDDTTEPPETESDVDLETVLTSIRSFNRSDEDANPTVMVNIEIDNILENALDISNDSEDAPVSGNGTPRFRRRVLPLRELIEASLSASQPSSPLSDTSNESSSSTNTLFFPGGSPMRMPLFSPSSSDSDDDDDDDPSARLFNNTGPGSVEKQITDAVDDVLNKQKPQCTWHSTQELMWREHGLQSGSRHRERLTSNFNSRFYGSRYVVERMSSLHNLRKHTGCVNCLNFNRSGELLCSGSDDCRIVVWDWAKKKPKHCFRSGHTENIFQTKFLDTSGSRMIIISASRDGQVRRSIVPSSGGKSIETECLYKHNGAVHKLAISPQNNNEVISVGEDAIVMHYDQRTKNAVQLTKVTNARNKKVRLYSVSHHPYAAEFCVSGFDSNVRIYDKRNCAKSVRELHPDGLNEKLTMPQVTSAVYNHSGTEILASYSDEHIYLFDNVHYKKGEFLHRYRGHYNHRTIKGVNFFGPNSEYIVSGSDCSHIFFWDKNTEAILNFMKGDHIGVVNCLEPHPSIPVLATSGLDYNVKIWSPNSKAYPPNLERLKSYVQTNLKRCAVEKLNLDDHQFRSFMRQFFSPDIDFFASRGHQRGGDDESSSEDDHSMALFSTESSSSSENGGGAPVDSLQCRTQ